MPNIAGFGAQAPMAASLQAARRPAWDISAARHYLPAAYSRSTPHFLFLLRGIFSWSVLNNDEGAICG